MARGRRGKKRILVPAAAQAMDKFKYEVASELGINPEYKSGYWGNISSRECGAVGGQMVRRMLASAEKTLQGEEGGFKKNPVSQ